MAKPSRYQQGQRWGFKTALPEFEHTLVIGEVDDRWSGPPDYYIYVRYNRDAGAWTPPGVDGVNLTLKAAGLNRSVTRLMESRVKLPEWWRFGRPNSKAQAAVFLSCATVDEGLRNILQAEREKEAGRRHKARAPKLKE